MLKRAASAALERGLEVRTRQHPAEAFPSDAGSFDLVASRVAPHHFSSPEKFVSEAARVLRPGGWFLLIEPTVTDGEAEAESWAHAVEKLRDPSHNRLLTPGTWSALCVTSGLSVRHIGLQPFKQPDIHWYFETAATPELNRLRVLDLVRHAPEAARRLFRIAEENGTWIWWWQRLTLIAENPQLGTDSRE
jgi:SAM-dependent methyltransferase